MAQRSSMLSDAGAQLGLLQDITSMSGAVSDAQILQLQCWPKVAAPNAKDFEVRLDQEAHRVEVAYRFGFLSPPRRDLPDWCRRMNGWIKELLGREWEVRVSANGRPIFLGPRAVAVDGVRTHGPREG